ncbi:DUF1367 family protein [Rodentibacter pneumotropicus]|uniref:DUF1367 family protein n=1 Tax=Rodentibacter pneumotropicus TaxID=758 RepID=A0A4S2Q3Z6_9PAST|nr:DUF1367 family protein [Rodentibacter pneumotropicus]THA11312.1 DUF1367 family protein [Rodentibacter pneumotropicus]
MAKFQMVKLPGGVFSPASEIDEERLKTLKNHEQYEIDVNLKINPALHRKMFSFFNFCFQYWCADNGFQRFANEKAQFEELRETLLIQAGHCEQVFSVANPGEFKLKPKSISYKELDDDIKRRELYVAITNAAMATIFKDCRDENVINQLYAFF